MKMAQFNTSNPQIPALQDRASCGSIDVDIMAGLSVVGLDPLTPTYFEMVLCDSLTRTARPAFLHLLSTFARRTSNVGNIGMYMLGYSEEVFLILKSMIDGYYIIFEEATWFEDFYGLKRCSERPPTWVAEHLQDHIYIGPEPPLVKRQLQGVFVDEIILPYIKVKVDSYYNFLQEKDFDRKISGAGPEPKVRVYNEFSLRCLRSYIRRVSQILSRIFFKIYPFISASNELLQFVLQVLYLFGATKYYTPLMYLLGVTMTRRQDVPNFVGAFIKSEEDYTKISEFIDMETREVGPTTWKQYIAKYFLNRDTPRYLLLFGVIGLKGLEWWYSDHVQNQREEVSLKIKSAPPPPRIKVLKNSILSEAVKDPTLCSICGKVRTNPTATPGGFVFCYPCVHGYVEKFGRCPVTKESVGIADLRKLYEST